MNNEQNIDSTQMTPAWSLAHQAEANKEGWDIFYCRGTLGDLWQLQRNDCSDQDDSADETNAIPVLLNSDDEAFQIVANGTAAHHKAAREFLKAHGPSEYAEVMAFKGRLLTQSQPGIPCQLWGCVEATGRECLMREADEAELRDECRRLADAGRDVWLLRADGMKELPSGQVIDPQAESNTHQTEQGSGDTNLDADTSAIIKAAIEALAWKVGFLEVRASGASKTAAQELTKAKAALAAAIAHQQKLAAPIFAYVQEGGSTGELYLHTFDSPSDAVAGRRRCAEGSYRTSGVIEMPGQFGSTAFHAVVEDILKASTSLDYPSEP